MIVAVVLLALLSTVCLAAIPYQTDRERAGLLGPIESVQEVSIDLINKFGEYVETRSLAEAWQNADPPVFYNSLGNVVSKRVWDNRNYYTGTYVYTYDDMGRKSVVDIVVNGNVLYQRAKYSYSSDGTQVTINYYYGDGRPWSSVTRVYDENGYVVKSGSTSYTYNEKGQVVSNGTQIYHYDDRGLITQITRRYENSIVVAYSNYELDHYGNWIKRVEHEVRTGELVPVRSVYRKITYHDKTKTETPEVEVTHNEPVGEPSPASQVQVTATAKVEADDNRGSSSGNLLMWLGIGLLVLLVTRLNSGL